MKILITGASGFIGRNVKEYLGKNSRLYDLYCPSSRELDCTDEKQVTACLEQHRFDYILHFAVYIDRDGNGRDSGKILEYNLRIFMNFAKNSHLYGKMYYAGSGAEYDKRYDIAMVREDDAGRTIPVDQYGLMKYISGQMAEHSRNIYNFRLFGVFGKYEDYRVKYISNICCKAIRGLPLTMRQDACFDYLWIGDFCRVLEFFLTHEPEYHTYNIVSGQPVRLEELSRIVLGISGKDLPVYICREGLAKEYTVSNGRFMGECPGFRFTPTEDAVRELYRWYEENVEIDLYKLLY